MSKSVRNTNLYYSMLPFSGASTWIKSLYNMISLISLTWAHPMSESVRNTNLRHSMLCFSGTTWRVRLNKITIFKDINGKDWMNNKKYTSIANHIKIFSDTQCQKVSEILVCTVVHLSSGQNTWIKSVLKDVNIKSDPGFDHLILQSLTLMLQQLKTTSNKRD